MIWIYVGNLPFTAAYNDLFEAFSEFGPVENLHIVTDTLTGRSKGFAFLEMPEEEGQAAINALSGAEYDGKFLEVNRAPMRRNRGRTVTYHRPDFPGDLHSDDSRIRSWGNSRD